MNLPNRVIYPGGAVRVTPAYWNNEHQHQNGNAICPGCGAIGRCFRLCLPCEQAGSILRVVPQDLLFSEE